jgi:hypothetical protein
MILLITEVTEMSGGHYCVAGWDAYNRRMVRPLPNGANWTAEAVTELGITPGVTLEASPADRTPRGQYPHLTEDTLVDPDDVRIAGTGFAAWFGPNAPPVAKSLQDVFGGHVLNNSKWGTSLKGLYVPAGTNTRSLGAIAIKASFLRFFLDATKLRAFLYDGANRYLLPVSDRHLNEVNRRDGLQAVKAGMPASGRLHVRLGLARGWQKHPDKCFVMLNGVRW